MRKRWRLILPIVGLILFAAETRHSVQTNREGRSPSNRYFWWSSIPLDSDPKNRHPQAPTPCRTGEKNCTTWELPYMWVDPGWLSKWLMLSAMPAFVVEAAILVGLSRLGINEIWGFMISMPLLIFAWYYFVGWLIDRWIFRLSRPT
jgi:hypothetical protein